MAHVEHWSDRPASAPPEQLTLLWVAEEDRCIAEETTDGDQIGTADLLRLSCSAGCLGLRSHVIVQHCCAETWFLDHRRMMTRNPTSPDLLRFQRFFDVGAADPEDMGCLPGYVTRASFTSRTESDARREEPRLHDTKRRPGEVLESHYFDALRERCAAGDLASLRVLLDTWDTITPPQASS